MRPVLPAAILAAGLACVLPAAAGEVENMMAVCSNPDTPPVDARNICRRLAMHGRLDARHRALAWLNAGITAYALELYREAVDAHSSAIEANPGLGVAYEKRALAQEKLGRVNEALEDYAAAISLQPDATGPYLGRGILMLNRGAAARALPDFDKVLKLDPALTAARYNRGLALLQLGANAQAEADFSAVIGQNPRDAGAFLNRGRARMGLGHSDARNDLDRAIALAPEWAAAWFMRGQLFDAEGKVEAANADFLRAYQLGLSDPWLIKRVRKISGQ